MDIAVCHFYGIEVNGVPLRKELEQTEGRSASFVPDYVKSVEYNRNQIYGNETPIWYTKNSPDIMWGPGRTVQIGYDMIAPFEEGNPRTKEEMDYLIYEITSYLFGEEEAKKHKPKVFCYGYDRDEDNY